jgi:two-component system, cell cycle sensor histidine kinase and response regulator CckA
LSTHWLAETVRQMDTAVYIWQLDTPDDVWSLRLIEANPSAAAFAETSIDELLGQSLGDARPRFADPAVPERYIEALSTGQLVDLGYCECYDRRARAKTYHVQVFPIGSDQVGVLFEDATERRRWERQATQMLKMEALGRLAGSIAHDFNNLLTVIVGNCQLLLSDPPPEHTEATRADLAQVVTAGESASALTRQLLAFSRQQSLAPQVFDLNDALTRLFPMLRRLIREDVEIVLDFEAGVALVNMDRSQLEQVLINLSTNARDAMPFGGVLTIRTAHVVVGEADERLPGLQPGQYAYLTVRDTGEGMPLDVQERIFEPFFTTKALGLGTGLGLATILGIIKQSGGYIYVESAPGQGTTFATYLPAVDHAGTKCGSPN